MISSHSVPDDPMPIHVTGNDVTVAFGAEAGQLELNVMEPVTWHFVLVEGEFCCSFPTKERENEIWKDHGTCYGYVWKPEMLFFLLAI